MNDDWDDEDFDSDNVDFSETQTCPSCRSDIYEDAEQCPVCGEYIVWSRQTLSGRPWWFVALGLVGILAVIWALSVGW
ncbi:MAG: hypothetical protein MK179_13295 [Pirellulaceae bacterium]|nr:hypothetical protein [Pirellulaceae bacterium]